MDFADYVQELWSFCRIYIDQSSGSTDGNVCMTWMGSCSVVKGQENFMEFYSACNVVLLIGW